MNNKDLSIIIMAAGKGTRLGGSVPKPLTTINNESILSRLIKLSLSLNPSDIVIVVGYKSEEIIGYVSKNFSDSKIKFAFQENLNGTLGAVEAGIKICSKETTNFLILPSDNGWFLTNSTISNLKLIHDKNKSLVSLLLTNEFNRGLHKIEYQVEVDEIKKIRLRVDNSISSDTYLAGTGILIVNKLFFIQNKELIPVLPNGEYTVSRIIEIALNKQKKVFFSVCSRNEILTINTPEDLLNLKNLEL